MKLYELNNQYQELMSMLEDSEIPQEAIEDTLESLTGDITEKLENYGKIIRMYQQRAEDIKEEVNRLKEREASAKGHADYMKSVVENTMRLIKQSKVETPLFTFSLAKSGGKAPLVLDCEVEELPDEFKKIEYKADNDKIREAIENGNCDFAHFEERKEGLRIK